MKEKMKMILLDVWMKVASLSVVAIKSEVFSNAIGWLSACLVGAVILQALGIILSYLFEDSVFIIAFKTAFGLILIGEAVRLVVRHIVGGR